MLLELSIGLNRLKEFQTILSWFSISVTLPPLIQMIWKVSNIFSFSPFTEVKALVTFIQNGLFPSFPTVPLSQGSRLEKYRQVKLNHRLSLL